MKRYTAGIDLGATNIKAGLILGDKILAKKVVPTADFPSREKLINALCEQTNQLLKQSGVSKNNLAGIGIGVPGPVDSIRGIVRYFPNIKGWHNVALKQILQKKTGLPVFIDNDANLMTLAEGRLGAAKGKKNVIGITLGTGVGGGILVNGCLYRGSSLSAGEIGHMLINERGPSCACGGKACLERYVGNKYILEKARKAFGNNITLEELSSLANRGNNQAIKIWRDTAGHLAVCLSGVVNFFNPEAIVIGGGVASCGKILFEAIKQGIKERAMPTQARIVQVLKAKLGNDAGMLGAALLVNQEGYNAKS